MKTCARKSDIYKNIDQITTANLGPNMPGLAQSTASRVDSSSKHIVACRVAEHFMLEWCTPTNSSDKRRELHVNKNKYCMFKNELVLNVSQPLFPLNSTRQFNDTKAYPNVVTTLADCPQMCHVWLKNLYGKRTATAFMNYWKESSNPNSYQGSLAIANNLKVNNVQDHQCQEFKRLIMNMPLFMAQGYALGTAWASQQTGDTVASVLIGGMQTVMNGAFSCSAGDVLQWYFDFEENEFADKTKEMSFGVVDEAGNATNTVVLAGQRLPFDAMELAVRDNVGTVFHGTEGPDVKRRRFFMEARSDGVEIDGTGRGLKSGIVKDGGTWVRKGCGKAFPKPYRMALCRNNNNRIEYTDHYGDRIRIFAKCISSARPHEMVDVMMMTQSL